MAQAALDGFPRTEVRVLVRDEERVVVSRQRSRGRILVLLPLAAAALVPLALDLRLDTVVLRCSRAEAGCTVKTGRAAPAVLPLSEIDRFTVRTPRKQAPRLVAETAAGEVLLVQRWSHGALAGHAAALNELLAGGGAPEWGFVYHRSAQAFTEDLPIFGGLFLLLAFLVAIQLGWRTRLDRRGRTVVRWKPLSRSVRRMDEFRAVLVRSMADAQPARAAAPAHARPMLEGHIQIALVDAQGSAWPITRWLTNPPDEVGARAAEVAAHLGLPVARPRDQGPSTARCTRTMGGVDSGSP